MRTITKLAASVLTGALAAGGLATPASAALPTVTAVTPTHHAAGVGLDTRPTATFSEPVVAGSLRYSFVRTAGAVDVSGHYRYDAAARTFTFLPRAPLAAATRYTLTVKVRGADGSMSRPYSWAFTTRAADTSPPVAPGAPTVGVVTSDSAQLGWAASTDDVGVTAYQIFHGSDSTPLATVTGAPPATATTLTGLTPATTYALTVRARDAAGHLSPPSPVTEVTTDEAPPPPDTTAPSTPGAPVATAVSATSATLTWAPSTDAVGVVEYRVAGGPAVTATTGPGTTLTGLTPQTAYTITVTAHDAAGNASAASPALLFTTPAVELVNARRGAGVPGATGNTLVLYDTTGDYAFLGEQYALVTAHLVSHFGDWTAQPVADYAAGTLEGFDAVIYLGSTYDEPLPLAFLDDVSATSKPVIWMYDNIWQLTARDPGFAAARGFTWTSFDFSAVGQVTFKGTEFTRHAGNGGGIMGTSITDPAKVNVVGEAKRADGTVFPWGVRSGNFTYLGEIPYSYMSADDRYLAFAAMLFDVLAPDTQPRRRALVRIEDVGPDADPAELRAITNYLYGKNIPFSVAVYSRYRDPNGVHTNGVPEDYTLAERPQVVAELKYMQSHGGTLLMHGYTHQYSGAPNPYNGVSADDFEFYRAHVDENDFVIYDGPVFEDSQEWAQGRIDSAFAEFAKAGLGVPTIFEFPHYAGSDADNRAVAASFGRRYDRGVYASGALRGGPLDYSRIVGQFFPYTVRDIYGVVVVPENLGNVELEPFNNHPVHLPADLVATAQRNTVIPDSVASFFFHPYLATSYLREAVEGIESAGYTFVPAAAM